MIFSIFFSLFLDIAVIPFFSIILREKFAPGKSRTLKLVCFFPYLKVLSEFPALSFVNLKDTAL